MQKLNGSSETLTSKHVKKIQQILQGEDEHSYLEIYLNKLTLTMNKRYADEKVRVIFTMFK